MGIADGIRVRVRVTDAAWEPTYEGAIAAS